MLQKKKKKKQNTLCLGFWTVQKLISTFLFNEVLSGAGHLASLLFNKKVRNSGDVLFGSRVEDLK
jgi:hypothetical protein